MIKPIVKDESFLMIESRDATINDLKIVDDLVDTLEANRKGCVGMAANMIGYSVNIIAYIDSKEKINVMINPKIIKAQDEYETEEGCLSLEGVRSCKRFKKIKVEFLNEEFKPRLKTLNDFEAEIVQHEIDHLFGIII